MAQTATYAGRSIITARLKNLAGLGEPKNIGWGTGLVTGSANSDVNLFIPASEARVIGGSTLTSTAFLADTYQVTGSVTAAGNKTITEAGLFDTNTNTPNTSLVLAAATNASVFSLAASIGPGSGNFFAQIANEVVLVTSGQAGGVSLGVVRAQLGSSAGSYTSGTVFTPGGDGGANVNGIPGGATATWTAALGGSMFAHADFAGVAVSTSDSINFTFRDQFN